MKRSSVIFAVLLITLLVFSACSSDSGPEMANGDNGSGESRLITDMAGRQVLIPNEVNSVFSTGASGTVLLYTIDPGLIAGLNYDFNKEESEYVLEEYRDLPSYGQGGGINLEAIIAAAPDLCISYGSISDKEISNAETLQEQTGIPFIIIDGSLDLAGEAYRFLGDALGCRERCEDLADYADNALGFASSLNVEEKDKVKVYFGNGTESLETAPVGSPHAELFELIGADNVAVVDEVEQSVARIDISAEQIIGWNPEVIIVNGEPANSLSPVSAADKFKNDNRYRNVKAVQKGKIHPIPKYPFSCFDRPPGVNRLIGIYWLSDILYPDHANIDIKHEMENFYSMFYHIELSEGQMNSLLGR